ncbi:MAG: transferrin receptor-like dimerization domain-containing protein [Gemmatimonadota bacterium]
MSVPARSLILTGALTALLAFTPAQSADPDLLGFTAERARSQMELEQRFSSQLQASNLEEWMRYIVSKPIYVGSPHNKETAEWMVEQFRSWGWQAELEEFQVLFPMPRTRQLELVAPTRFRARLQEPTLKEDATSNVAGRLPTYNAYSADGDVTGELVYVNYGIPADYEELARRGIDVKGKIVIARYGGSWRGIKPKVAYEHGAIGCIIYSDPRDDGYYQGDVYPEGAYRMKDGVQRGSVVDMPQYPGDPLTPGRGAKAETERYTVEESPVIMKIPVLPISYADAQPLLAALGGPVAPGSWRGALPITYHMGPGPARVHLKLEFDWSLKPAYDVIARIQGSEYPDEWVVRGNHRDGWAMGAGDPISGMVAVLEEARAIGELMKTGWRPRRTIIYAGWDGEEPGLLGSTEWAEQHAAELQQKAVLYLNTDGNGRGFLGAGGSHALESFVNQVAKSVTDPQTGVSAWQRTRAAQAVGGDREAMTRAELRISPLGSGSDYTPFLQHLGIQSLNVGFGGEGGGGSYHSQFDSFDHYSRFGDPGFHYGVALADVAGRIVLRFAEADVLPMRFAGLADNVRGYLGEVEKLADDQRAATERENKLIEEGAYKLAADPTETWIAPESKAEVPYFNFAPLQNAVRRLEEAATAYDRALPGFLAGNPNATTVQRVNDVLQGLEQRMMDEGGLPRRPWFRHRIYAPGFYTGYGVKTLPGVREAIEEREFDQVPDQVQRTAAAIERAAAGIEEATRALGAM